MGNLDETVENSWKKEVRADEAKRNTSSAINAIRDWGDDGRNAAEYYLAQTKYQGPHSDSPLNAHRD